MKKDEKKSSYGNKLGYNIFRRIILHFGVSPAYAVLVFVIGYYVLCRPSAYRAASHYIKRRFPGRSWPKRLWLTYKYYYNFGLCLIDQAAVSILGSGSFKIEFPDADKFKELAKEGRGIVFLTSHTGVWQQAISTLGYIGRNIYLNLRREMHAQAMGLAQFENPEIEINVISPDNFLGGVPELSTALLRGNLAAVMGDRVFGEGSGKRVKFLGDEALFPLLPHHLALTTNSDLVVFLASRVGSKHFFYEAKIKRITDDIRNLKREEARACLLGWYVEILEKYLENHPFMWYNFIDSWKK